ncbi:hypothetical protein M0534_05925 [Methylonatrum kenyense]|uniref:hypothetical protein n=1 Tax=Methylonatrum kenyense TaxID=455253 RepID=UPI0020C03FB0|nr:hypothetical protein [Methylonatrum kenyense]MCK8515862.1 hypothetical protein [Methylonatrum kenyense]
MARSTGRDPLDGRPTIFVEDGDTTDDLRAAAEAAGIWKVSSVEDEPSIRATHWKIYGVRGVETAMLLACYNPAGREGRVSTRITEIDEGQMRIRTKSGRVYELHGPPAVQPHPDTAWVLEVYFRRLGIDRDRMIDVTPRLFPDLYSPSEKM